LFSDDDVTPRLGLGASYDIATLERAFTVAAEVGWSVENEDNGTLMPEFEQAELSGHHLNAAARLRYALNGWLEPHARLSAGISLMDVALRAAGTSEQFEQDAVLPFGTLGAGFSLRSPDRALAPRSRNGFSAGVSAEGGYLLSSSLEVALQSTEDPGRISTERASLGLLSRSGPYVRAGAFVRF
jgi:hypothetical protein